MAAVVAGSDILQAIASLEDDYEIADRREVEAFLVAHPEVVGLLQEASARIPGALPTHRPILIEVLHDQEEETEGDLFAVVATESTPEDALPRMADFRQAWLVDAVRRARGRFNVVLRYV